MSKTTKEMKLIDINKLIPYVNNARTHSPEQINKLRSSRTGDRNHVFGVAHIQQPVAQ